MNDLCPLTQVSRNYLFFGGEGGGGYTSLAAILEGVHISLVMCVRGYTYHGSTHITVTPVLSPKSNFVVRYCLKCH